VIGRQGIVGWVLIAVAGAYIVYFLRVRLLVAGPVIEKKEWIQLIGCVILLMIGTANVRLAAIRARNHNEGSSR
jgi:hypothetical protein